jgi:hypothetical protein
MMKIRRLKIIAEFPDYVQVFSTAVQFPITWFMPIGQCAIWK